MRKNLSNILQLKKSELQEIADAVNIYAGQGIQITRTGSGLEISWDEQYVYKLVRDTYNELIFGKF